MKRSLGNAIAAGAIAAGALLTLTASANAEPIQSENEIRRGCSDANGGQYKSELILESNGRNARYSSCTYHDIGGNVHTDGYRNGRYILTHKGPRGSNGEIEDER